MLSLISRSGIRQAAVADCRLPVFTVQQCGIKNIKPPKTFDHIYVPEIRRLPSVPKSPTYPAGQLPPKMMKMLKLIRGPETIHNKLIYKQYGLVAIRGGRLKHLHFEVIRKAILEKVINPESFAVWRVDPPWQACTKRPIGITLGGGKPNIHHYVTPVKAHRVIFEIGGKIEYEEVKDVLEELAEAMPFAAKAVSQEILEEDERKEIELRKNNLNYFTYEYILKNNMLGCRKWAKEIDYKYFGKYM